MSVFTPIDSISRFQGKTISYPSLLNKTLTNKLHFNYYKLHFLLSYKWKNSQGFIKTCYLDKVFEQTFPNNYSEPEAAPWWHSFIDNLKLYRLQLLKKFKSSVSSPSINKFIADTFSFLKTFNISYYNSMSYRRDVEQIYYQIFKNFNECLNDFDTDKDINIFDIKLRRIDVEAVERQNYIKNNQELFKTMASLSNPTYSKRRGRPRKTVYHYPDLYGY